MPNYTYIINDVETQDRPAQYESDDAFIAAGGIIVNHDVDGEEFFHNVAYNWIELN